jgi:hypothetical protein
MVDLQREGRDTLLMTSNASPWSSGGDANSTEDKPIKKEKRNVQEKEGSVNYTGATLRELRNGVTVKVDASCSEFNR